MLMRLLHFRLCLCLRDAFPVVRQPLCFSLCSGKWSWGIKTAGDVIFFPAWGGCGQQLEQLCFGTMHLVRGLRLGNGHLPGHECIVYPAIESQARRLNADISGQR